jgi:hypothetical protein
MFAFAPSPRSSSKLQYHYRNVALRIRVSRHKEDKEMSLLPLSTPPRASSPANGFARGKTAVSKMKVLLRRGINFKQMVGVFVEYAAARKADAPLQDFELAAWQITYLFFSPRRVSVVIAVGSVKQEDIPDPLYCRYRNVYYHKQTKNTWARDDPALVLLQCGCLAGAQSMYYRPIITTDLGPNLYPAVQWLDFCGARYMHTTRFSRSSKLSFQWFSSISF